MAKRWSESARLRAYQGGLHLIALGLTVYWLYRLPPQWSDALPSLVSMVFIALVTLFPTRLRAVQVFPFQLITLGLALIRGPTVAVLTAMCGLLFGVYVLPDVTRRLGGSESRRQQVMFNVSWHVIPLLIAGLPFSWQSEAPLALTGWRAQGAFIGLAVVMYLLLQFVFVALQREHVFQAMTWPDVYRSVMVHLLPLPFVWGMVSTYDQLGLGALALIGGLTAVLHVLGWGMGTARVETDLRQQEIRLIESVGRTLRDTLDLETLLTTIQRQVTQRMGVENFYVALLDAEDQHIWYPLAVKNGKRQEWPRRPLEDRLTDRVIVHGQPILLSGDVGEQLKRIGLPAGEDPPSAWLGVPLITQGRTIGCLAAFSMTPGVTFDRYSLQVLEALSGQVSVAIQNALLYQQAQQRAAQLEALTEASATLTATLNPAEVLVRVCEAATLLADARRVALFQIDADQQMAYLAQSLNLSPRLQRELTSVMLDGSVFGRNLSERQPVLVPDVERTAWHPSLREVLKQEGIHAAAFFPLGGSRGRFGTLAVWFERSRLFGQDFVHLMQSFAAQAALAIANARLYAHTDTALSRRVEQLSILEAIGRELAAAIRSEQVFEMALRYAAEFTRSEWGVLSLWDEEERVLKIHTVLNYPGGLEAGQEAFPLAVEALRRQQVIQSERVRKDRRFVDYTEGRAQSHISIPLMHEGQVLGVISLESSRIAAYDENEILFLQQLANQAAVALINARLYRQSQAHLQELALLYQTGVRLSSTVDIQTVLEILTQSISELEPHAQAAAYLWRQGAYRRWAVRADTHPLFAYPEKIHLADLGSLASALTQTGPLYLAKEEPLRAKLQVPEDVVVTLFPLQVARERLGMVVVVLVNGQRLKPSSEQMIRAITTQGSLALQNAVLFGNVRQMRDRLMAVLNSVGDGVMMIQSDGGIALANAPVSDLVGLPLRQLLGRRLQELPPEALAPLGFTPSAAARLVAKLNSSYAPTMPPETYRFNRGGQELVMQRITAPVMDEKGTVIGWVIVFHDVTEQYHLNQARDMIADTLVHDLRSPLSAIISALDLIQVEVEQTGAELAQQSVRIAQRSAQRLVHLVQSLLEISRMEAGMIELSLQMYPDLAKLVCDVAEDYLPQATEHGLRLCWDVPETLPPIRMDEGKITRVLINLIDNALKFTPEGGMVQITAAMEDETHVRITVRDTGPGIPPEFLQSIFERFVQVPGRRGRRRGIGLGLTFSRLVVEAHGGRIRVRNHPEGGAEFSLVLPLSGPETGENS